MDLKTHNKELTSNEESKFVIGYQENPKFTGRKAFLLTLKQKLFEQIPKQYNHRIALYGIGGIGKMQTALKYVSK